MEANVYYPFINLPLPYDYDALEPYIDTKTMQLHHDRHLQTYIDNLNAVLKENPQLQKFSLEQLIRGAHRLPRELQTQVRNNAGGVYNHRFFFENMTPSSQEPSGEFANTIEKTFGGYETFEKKFTEAALSVFGSGYAWLVSDRGKLRIVTSPNQNTPLEKGLCPILNLDVWEHAYYLKHYNRRADYISDWFHAVNWDMAEDNYRKCMEKRRY